MQEKIYLNDESENNDFPLNDNQYDYSKFNTCGFELDRELTAKFAPIAKKLNLSQESVDLLLELALEMSKKQRAIYEKDEEARLNDNVAKYDKMFKDDPDLPKINSNSIKQYMQLSNEAYNTFCSKELKDLFKKTGLNYHPELIKMFNKIGELIKEDGINYNGKPSVEELTPAQILYGPRE